MPWYAPWSESIKKRACRYLLQRYLGCFLEEKLTLEQLSVDLYRGTGTVSDLALDTEAINELGDSQNWPLQIVDGYMQKISVSIPWSTLLKDDSVVEVYGLSVTVQPKMRAEPGSSMLESMWSSMSSSMQLAAECLQADAVPDAQPVEGIEMFAHTIDSILSRVKVKFINTKIRIEHVPKNSDTGIALEIHIRNIDYLDEAGSEPPSELIDSEQNKTYVVSTFTSKRIAFEGVTFFTDEYPSKARTISRSLIMERSLMTQSVKTKTPEDINVESVLSDVYFESTSTFDSKCREGSVYMETANDSSENTLKFESSPDEEKPSHNEPILFAKLISRQELSLKIKQSDEASGPKVNLQLTLGSLILFLSPRQLHVLLELANGLSSPHLEDTSNMPLRTGGLTECKPMRAADFQRVEAQLIGTLAPPPVHHLNARGWSGHSLDESDLESEKFHPLTSPSGNTMTDSCNSSVSSMSASATSSVSGFANTSATTHARIKRNRKVPQIDGDPTAEVSHVDIRVASCSCILLHKDILIPTPVGTECNLPPSAKKMHLTACDFFDKLGFFAVSGYGNKDFELANQMFDKATTLSHLRLISTSLTLDGSEKTTSQGCQTTGHLTIARLHLRECLYQAENPGDKPTLESCDLVYFDRNVEGSNTEEAFANPLGSLPDVKLAFKQTQKAMRIAGEKKLVYPTTDICVTCSACSVQVDVTLLDRLTDVRHGGAPCAPRAAPPPPPAATSPAEHQRSFSLHCPNLNAILRFPIVELRAGVSRETRRVRPDYLRCGLAGVEVTSTLAPASRRPAPTSVHLQSQSVHLYYHENDSDSGTHIAHATVGESVDPNILTGSDSKIPSVSLTFLPTKSNKGPFDSSSDEEAPYEHGTGNPMTHSVHLMDQLKDNSNPSPFSSKKMVHQSDTARDNQAGDVEELVVPGSAQEMQEFTQHATTHAAIHLACCFPNLSLQLQSKQLYEVLYNRINTDLMLWEPWVPERAAFPLHASIQPQLHLPEPNIYPAFAACKSALDYDSDTASSSSSDDNVYYSTYESRAKHKRLAARVDAHGKALHDFCLTLRVHDGLLTIFTPVRDGSNRVVPGQAGELQIVTSRLSMCQVSGVRGRAKHALMCLRAHTATLFHAPLVPSSSEKPSLHLHGGRPAAHMAETIYPSGSGVTLHDGNSKDVLSLAIGVEPHKDLPNFKKIRVALGMERATLRHRGAHGTAWLSQLLDQLDVADYPVPGYRPSTVLTELHVHLWDCAVDYRPLYLPIRSVITLGSFSVSSNVIANTNTSNLRFIAQECALFLMQAAGKAGQPVPLDDDKPVELQKNYVCVLDLGLFELSLRMTDKNYTSGPQVELRASNNVVHARTCWDSASALGRLLTYVAASSDTQPPAPDTPHTSVYSERADALLVGVDEKLPEEIRELSPSEVQQVHDLMAEAMKESPNSTATDEELAKSGEKEGVEVFFFPDESNPKSVENPTLSREPSDASSEPRDQGLKPGEENYFEAEKEEAPTIAQVARELGDPTAKTDTNKPERQAKTSEGGNTDDEFCVVERSGAEDEELAEPTVRWLSSEPVPMLENHFTVPLAKTDVLRPPKNFPTPILRYTLCEMSVIWHMYGGNDFKQPSDETSVQSKKHVTINQQSHSPTSEKRGASYEPYETSRQTAAAYLQRGVAWGRGEGLRPGGAPPAPRRLAAWRQRGGPQRDLHTHVEIQLNKVRFQHESYGAGLAQAARQTLAVGKLEVRDRLAASDINKFLSHHVSKEEPERRHAHMVVVKAVHLRPEPALPAQECCLKVSLLPLRFHIDQDTLLFLVHFFSKLGSDPDTTAASEEETRSPGGASSDASSPKVTPTHRPPVMSLATHLRAPPPPAPSPDTLSLNHLPLEEGGQPLLETYEAERMVSDNLIQLEEEWRVGAGSAAATGSLSSTTATSAQPDPDASPLYFRRVVFAPDVPIRLDYVGKRVDLSAGPVAGLLMGLGQLNCSELRLKRLYHRHGILGVERLVRWALQEWLSDIKRHQLPGLLSGIGPMHSLLQLLTGMRDLLWLPVEQWRRDGRLVHGLRRGAASFTARTAVAALDITARILHIIQATAETALDMLTPGPTLQLQGAYEQRRRRRRRRNDPSRQPTDIREGVANAVQIVREGIAETAETMSLAARSERGVGGVLRHLPGAAVAPLALAAAGAADVLGGVRSQLVPHHRRHHTDKWRVHTDLPEPH